MIFQRIESFFLFISFSFQVFTNGIAPIILNIRGGLFVKSLLACLGLMIAGIATALFIGFHDHTGNKEIVYDDDQEGPQDQIIFTFSHVVAENTPKGLAANKFADLVNEKSGGKIKIEVFPNGSLYSDIEEIEALQNGDVQFIAPSTSKLGMLSPEWGCWICRMHLQITMPSKKG